MSIIFFILAIFIDALMYGYYYQRLIKTYDHSIGLFNIAKSFWTGWYGLFKPQIKWLFQEYSVVITKQDQGVILDHRNVFRYRILVQFVIDAVMLYLIYNYGIGFTISVWPPLDWAAAHLEFVSALLGIFLVVKEFGYYLVLDQTKLVKEYKGNPCWLDRKYFVTGYFKFSYNRFKASFIVGCIVILIPYLLNLITLFYA